MRKITVFPLVILLAMPILMGMGFVREYQFEADGIVDAHTVINNQVAISAMKITGEGTALVKATAGTRELSLQQDYDIMLKSKLDKTLSPLEAIVSSTDLLEEQFYAGYIEPSADEFATMRYNIDIVGGELAQVKVTYETTVSQGRYKHYINMFNEDVSLYEYYDIKGRAYFRDSLVFSYHDTEEE